MGEIARPADESAAKDRWKEAAMTRYMVQGTHTEEECGKGAEEWLALDLPRKAELFDALQFGCEAGVHETWLVGEFENEDEVWSYIPPSERAKTRVVPINSYSFDEMVLAHET
jgi:hypothetical protein